MTGLLSQLAEKLQVNAADESEAIVGYVQQQALIEQCLANNPDAETKKLLEELLEQTKEYISDEQQHNISLMDYFIKLTGIIPAKD